MYLIESREWKRGTLDVPMTTGNVVVTGVSKQNLFIDADPQVRTESGWYLTYSPTGHLITKGKTKASLMLLGDMLLEIPGISQARTVADIMKHASKINVLLRAHTMGTLDRPSTVRASLTGPADPERLRHLAALGDAGAADELARLQKRRGQTKVSPKVRVADKREQVIKILREHGLQSLGQRYGKAGEFFGKKGHTRAVSVGSRDILVNRQKLHARHYYILSSAERGKAPKIEVTWTLKKEYPIKTVTEETLSKIAKYVAAAPTTVTLRAEVREQAKRNVARYMKLRASDPERARSETIDVIKFG